MDSKSGTLSTGQLVIATVVGSALIFATYNEKQRIKKWIVDRRGNRRNFRVPPALRKGDKVAVLACSSGVAAVFPWVRDQGLKRLREEFGLVPVTYPSMEKVNSTPEERAAEINNAFADPGIKGIICSIGGDDLNRVIKFVDEEVIRKNPKCLFGYSDITTLHLLMFKCGIVSYYGANLMAQFGMSGKMHDFTVQSITEASMDRTMNKTLKPSDEFLDGYLEWGNKGNLTKIAEMEKNELGWIWYTWDEERSSTSAPPGIIKGRLFGGCVSTLYKNLGIGRYVPLYGEITGAILFIETSETMPHSSTVYDFLATLGELEILQQFRAIL